MTLRHLRIFVEVCRFKSMTKAAEYLQLSQPAVSRAIKELEDHYGVCLFERINRRLTLTDCGNRLFSQAIHLLDGYDQLEECLANNGQFGTLRVGASITLGNFLLPDVVTSFHDIQPNVRVQVTIANSGVLQKHLLDSRLDLAMIEGGLETSELVSVCFGSDCLVLIVPPNSELATRTSIPLEDLAQYPLLLRERGSVGRTLIESVFCKHELPLSPAWESASTQAAGSGREQWAWRFHFA